MRTNRPGPARRPARLRTRVLAGIMSVTLVTLAAFDIAAVTMMHRYLVSQTDQQLRNIISLYEPLNQPAPERSPVNLGHVSTPQQLEVTPPSTGPTRIMVLGPALVLPSKLSQYAVSYNGPSSGYGGGNPALFPTRLSTDTYLWALRTHEGATVDQPGGPIRIMVADSSHGELLVITSLAGVNRTVARLELILVTGSLAAALLVALGGGWLIRRGLRPLETMAAQADRITAGNLTDRVGPADDSTEAGRLGSALNGMLTRIEASVAERDASQEATRRFFADASHELRNPLASLSANAELYAEGAVPGRAGVDEVMRRIGLETHRMSTLVDDMLRLARIDQHPGRRLELVDLTALVTSCAERAQLIWPGQAWRLEIAGGLVTEGDSETLRRAIDNLLANVSVHTPDGTTGTITAAPGQHGTVTVEVSDDGPGLPPEQLPRIFDRFYRGSAPAGRPGSGLGLAIVAAIAAAHHGTATASLNQSRGLTLTLALPVPQPTGPLPAVVARSVPSRIHRYGNTAAGRIAGHRPAGPGVPVPAGLAPAPSRPVSRASQPGPG